MGFPRYARTTITGLGFGLLTLLMLQACGGGGGGGGASDSTDATPGGVATAASPAPGSPPPSPGATDTGCGFASFQAEMLRLVNAQRAAGATCGTRGSFPPVPALAWESRLSQAAYDHSLDMATANYFSHTGRDGRSPFQRVAATGYTAQAVGENIAAGYGSMAAVVDGWMGSEGHCANLMSASYSQMGLACARGSASQYGIYWTQVLARPR